MRLSLLDSLPHRSHFIRALGFASDKVFALRQVHSRGVVIVERGDLGGSADAVEADGMITARRDVLLTVTVADCLPIILFDVRTGSLGLVHSGWKGTGIVTEALRLMGKTFDTRGRDVRATIGPGIGACCYTVPEDRALRFAAEFGAGSVRRREDGRQTLDLRAANVSLLSGAGVEDITVVGDCTCCTPSLGSFRRQGPQEHTLMLAWVCAARGAAPSVP
jgi:hypothetical protein